MEQSEYYKQKRNYERFQPNLDNLDSVKLYFRNFSVHLLYSGLKWSGVVTPLSDWGAETSWTKPNGEIGYSVYVYNSHRGQGHMTQYLKENTDRTIYTFPTCNLEPYLKKKHAKYEVLNRSHPYNPEYKLVADFYGDRVTDRTGCHMINHIDEGIWILQAIGASDETIRAYIIHPLVQGDAELGTFWRLGLYAPTYLTDPRVLYLALEYRNIANAHLSWHPPPSKQPFNDSPLNEVNQMLVADKVQNRKDFELYHMGTHPRSDRLLSYFHEWLEKLEIKEETYQSLSGGLKENAGGDEMAMLQKQIVGKSKEATGEKDQLGYLQVFGGGGEKKPSSSTTGSAAAKKSLL